MIQAASITAIEHSQSGVRAVESEVPYIHFMVDDDMAGIALLVDEEIVRTRNCGKDGLLYMIGLKKPEAKLFCTELIGMLDQYLGVTV